MEIPILNYKHYIPAKLNQLMDSLLLQIKDSPQLK